MRRSLLAAFAGLMLISPRAADPLSRLGLVRRAMPFDAPQSLTPDEVYAVSAYLLHRNGILPEDAGLDAASLARVVMPNRDGFTTDPRPDLPAPTR